jgi:hypothetical protein
MTAMTLAQAAALMRDGQTGLIPNHDTGRNLIGTLTDRGIAVRVVAEGESPNQRVGRFLSRERAEWRDIKLEHQT